jgi:hypothetical protein
LLKISKVLTNKNEDVENKKKEIIEKENEIFLRELKLTEIQDNLQAKYSMRDHAVSLLKTALKTLKSLSTCINTPMMYFGATMHFSMQLTLSEL